MSEPAATLESTDAPALAGRATRSARLAWFILGALPAAVIFTATTLVPDPSGHGTHTQLGLPPCGFLVIFGFPCPGCGLTTCFAHMTRFDFVGAAAANPFGILLFLVSFFTIPVSAVGFVRGLPVFDTLERLHFEKWAILLAVTGVSVWVVRIVTMVFGL